MAYEYLTALAQQWVAEQGAEASEHLADAIRDLRAAGDEKGARLFMRIAERVDMLDIEAPRVHGFPTRRSRNNAFGPST